MLTPEDVAIIEKATKIRPGVIDQEFVHLPGDLAYWNARYAEALREAMHAKNRRETVEAQVGLEVRAAAKAQGAADGKKGGPTVDEVRALVQVHEGVQAAIVAEIEAEAERERLRGVVSAIAAKRECLVSLGAHIRLEMQSDPNVRLAARVERMEGEAANR